MYKCDKCGRVSQPGEKCNIVPVKFRKKYYPEHDTEGNEIVKEQKLCIYCIDDCVHIKMNNGG